ncbi:MAG: TonB family protein [Terriglobales bacterium]
MQSILGSARETASLHGYRSAPRLLVELEPWHRSFFNNLREFLLPQRLPPLHLTSRPAAFWPDVFVSRTPPWRSLRQSGVYHLFALTVLLTFPDLWRMRPNPDTAPKARSLTYYEVSEYLPNLSAGSAPAKVARKGKPAYSKQPVISLPPEPDNFSQTIVDPLAPNILRREARLPNMVVWTPVPSPAPVAASARSASKLTVPWLQTSVIAPAPEVAQRKTATLQLPKMPAPSVIDPPPTPEALRRKLGEINMGNVEPTVAAPALPVPEQRAAADAVDGVEAAPPPSAGGGGSAARAAGQLIALGLNPVTPTGPVELAGGSRRGQFAATPEGTPGAYGTPDVAGGGSGAGGTGTGGAGGPGSGPGGNPSGVYIGGGPTVAGPVAVVAGTPGAGGTGGGSPGGSASAGNRNGSNVPSRERILASAAPPPRIARENVPRSSSSGSEGGKIEDKVFGPKRYYSMAINMPNLTSAGGSWIIRFAQLKDDTTPGDLTAPSATAKVDPAYPADMMRRGVEGRVVLYAVIHSDGSVGEVRVLRGFDDQLDENARAALERWRFRPATKNGQPIDLEAVVEIPFMARKFGF